MVLATKFILLALLSFTLMAFSTFVAMRRPALGAFIVVTGALGIALLFSRH